MAKSNNADQAELAETTKGDADPISIILNRSTINNAGHYLDAGEVVVVGENLTQIHPGRLDDLLESGTAVIFQRD